MIVQPRRQQGFTVIELLMSVAILVVLMCISLPSVGNLLGSSESKATRQAIIAALNTARASAVHANTRSVVCPSVDGETCSGGLRWDGGWIAFTDRNGNGHRDADDTLISVHNVRTGSVAMTTTSGRDRVVFRPDGSSGGSNVTFTICDRRGATTATSVVVSNPGRVRGGTATAIAAQATCALLGSAG